MLLIIINKTYKIIKEKCWIWLKNKKNFIIDINNFLVPIFNLLYKKFL